MTDRSSGKKAKIHFVAKHPQNLVQFLRNKKSAWEKRINEIEKDLPMLISLYKSGEKPVVKFKEGVEGAKEIYWETLESKTVILSVLDLESWYTPELNLYKWGKKYTQERSKRKISKRVLLLDTHEGRDWMKYYQGSFKYTHYRWIKPEQVPAIKDLGGEINIYENKVMMALFKKPNSIGILIESTVLANILKAMFELAWQIAVPAKIGRRGKK